MDHMQARHTGSWAGGQQPQLGSQARLLQSLEWRRKFCVKRQQGLVFLLPFQTPLQ